MNFKKILIVGFGSIGRRHYDIVKRLLPGSDVKVLRTSGTNNNLELDQFSSINQALLYKPDISVICCPATCHVKFALPLALIGSHLLIEKPVEVDLVEANKLNDSSPKDLVIQVGYNLRFSKALRFFRDKVLAGGVGDILSVRAEVGQYLPSWRVDCDYKKSVSSLSHLGGGVLFELSHEIDYLLWIFGMPKAVLANHLKSSDLSIDVEDCAHLILQCCSMKRKFMVRLDLDFIRHDPRRVCEVIGTEGTLQCDLLRGKVNFWQSGGSGWENIFSDDQVVGDTYLAEWNAFLESIESGSSPQVSLADGINVLRVILAAKKSNIEKKEVSVELSL